MHFKEAKSILSAQNGINVYRGCAHGCIYCDSRSLCYNMNHDFEDIEVKINAPELLEQALKRKRKKCMIGTGSMCDPYMQCEEKLLITRKCFEIIAKYGFGAAVLTKSQLILRDIDILTEINNASKCVIQMTLTTADENLCRIIEPNVSSVAERTRVLKIAEERGIPTAVWFTPILPFINDTKDNIQKIVEYCAYAGVKRILFFGAGLTLRDGSREYFYAALDRNFKNLKNAYINKYGNSYYVTSEKNEELSGFFYEECAKYGIISDRESIFAYLKEFPQRAEGVQLSFTDE